MILLAAFSPMLFFFDRTILAETMLRTGISLWVWSLLLAFDRRRANFALVVLCGLLFIAALFAKVTALIVLPLPIVIAVVFTRWPISDRLKALALLYATAGITWLPFGLAFSSRQIDYFGLATKIAPTPDVLLGLDRLGLNLSLMLEGLLAYHSICPACSLVAMCAFRSEIQTGGIRRNANFRNWLMLSRLPG